jgi:pimeloyl-ACP methyl ester carboxylesterase
MKVREYGASGPWVIVVHGGPGAPGYLAPVARELAGEFRVLEPFQRRSGAEPLTIARHVEDLHECVMRCAPAKPALVGHSFGAMLALAYAAAHPDATAALVLVGCGTFDRASREQYAAAREARTDARLREQMRLAAESPDPDEGLKRRGALMLALDSYDPIPSPADLDRCDARGHEETWSDMIRLQETGVYPAAFAAIREPVLMLHGTHDPHPGRMIRASLEPHTPHLEYREWERCGHYPWLEKAARDEFFELTKRWLRSVTAASPD